MKVCLVEASDIDSVSVKGEVGIATLARLKRDSGLANFARDTILHKGGLPG